MAKRDPALTLRNKEITAIGERLTELLPEVLEITELENVHELHARYGGKNAVFIDMKNEVIHTPEQFITLWLKGYHEYLESLPSYSVKNSAFYKNFVHFRDNDIVREYVIFFLTRTYLRNFDALSKKRPQTEDSVIWIGQENASYGLLITPRFSRGQWENDGSEIRHFKKHYFTIGHVLQTGLVIPFDNDSIQFESVDSYLSFFKNTIVRASGSKHELEIAQRYCNFVKMSEHPENVPLLIPEFRYGGIDKKHIYRLDFCIIDPFTLSKVGFELSPWSTHGELKKIAGKSQKEINEIAKANYEKEMKKLKAFFRSFNITVLVYTDSDFQNYDKIFEEMKKYLTPKQAHVQLKLQVLKEFLEFAPA